MRSNSKTAARVLASTATAATSSTAAALGFSDFVIPASKYLPPTPLEPVIFAHDVIG